MNVNVNYNQPAPAASVSAKSITTTESDLMVASDLKFSAKSQLTAYFNALLGTATKIKIRYYYTADGGATWFQVPVKNLSTGQLSDIPSVIDSTSPNTQSGGVYKLVEDIGISGSMGFKATGQTDTGTATLTYGALFVRDN